MFDRIYFASVVAFEKRPDLTVPPMLFTDEEQCMGHIARMEADQAIPGPVMEMFGPVVRKCVRVRVTELDEAPEAYDPVWVCGHRASEHNEAGVCPNSDAHGYNEHDPLA